MVEVLKTEEIPEGVFFEMENLSEFHDWVTQAGWFGTGKSDIAARFPSPRFVAKQSSLLGRYPRRFYFDSDAISTLEVPAAWTFKVTKLADRMPLGLQLRSVARQVHTTGCDPEIFVVDGANRMIPAFQFLPNKHEAKPHSSVSTHDSSYPSFAGSAYWDGFQAEFSCTPTHCHGYQFDMIRQGLRKVIQEGRKVNPKAKLTLKNVFRISEDVLAESAPEHVALGCDPSLNAYASEPFRVDNPREFPYRVAGGHIHFALQNAAMPHIPHVVKAMDLLAALPAVGMFAEIDNPLRREFYGKAGEYRTPKYGVEYRTLSNAWLGHPAVGHLLFELARQATALYNFEIPYDEFGTSEEEVQEVINHCDVKSARAIFAKSTAAFKRVMGSIPNFQGRPDNAEKLASVVQGGVESLFPEYREVEKNWKLDGSWATHTDQSRRTWNSAAAGLPGSI